MSSTALRARLQKTSWEMLGEEPGAGASPFKAVLS